MRPLKRLKNCPPSKEVFQTLCGENSWGRPLFPRECLLVPRIHEGAVATLRALAGVVDRGPLLVGVESTQQLGVGPELRRTAIKLPRVAYHHPRSSMHGPHNATDVHVHVAVLAQFAHLVA